MAIIHFRCKERRRTLRVSITVALTVHGTTDDGENFSTRARSQSVNRNGALLHLDQIVVVGQSLLLVNDNSNRTAESRVVSIKRDREGKTLVAVEFVTPDANFWHMTFPIPGAKPLRRPIVSKVSA
jgi:c-di-GMP-binding flagellar brake protein YcgR